MIPNVDIMNLEFGDYGSENFDSEIMYEDDTDNANFNSKLEERKIEEPHSGNFVSRCKTSLSNILAQNSISNNILAKTD